MCSSGVHLKFSFGLSFLSSYIYKNAHFVGYSPQLPFLTWLVTRSSCSTILIYTNLPGKGLRFLCLLDAWHEPLNITDKQHIGSCGVAKFLCNEQTYQESSSGQSPGLHLETTLKQELIVFSGEIIEFTSVLHSLCVTTWHVLYSLLV